MAAYLTTCFLAFLAACPSSIVALSEENIPIIAWSNSKSLASARPFAQGPLSVSLDNVLYSDEKLILFTQDKLSFDDLAKYGGLYGDEGSMKNVKKFVSDSESSVLLSVPYQPNLVEFIVSEMSFLYAAGNVHHFSSEDIISGGAKFEDSKCKLCVIRLPEAASISSPSSDRASSLAEMDEFISLVMSKDIVRQNHYIAMVAAEYSQVHHKEQATFVRSARAQAADNTSTCNNDYLNYCSNDTEKNCTYYMRLDEILVTFGTWNISFVKNGTSDNSPSCNTDSSTNRTFSVNYTNNSVNMDIRYIFTYDLGSLSLPKGFWMLSLGVNMMNQTAHVFNNTRLFYKKEGLPPYPLSIPDGASLHCSDAVYCVESTSDMSKCDDGFPRVIFKNLQVELFRGSIKSEFSIAYDCESYFSATTWMGVLMSVILLPILITGLFLVFQTQTMDRFDDPREPALTTTVTTD